MFTILLLILIKLYDLLVLIIKMEMEKEMNTYYILITSLDVYQDKLNTMLKLLSDQIDHYNYNKTHKQPVKIIVCTDTIDIHVKQKLLLKEIYNSIYYTFLDVTDNIDTMYIINFIDSMHIYNETYSNTECCCNSM